VRLPRSNHRSERPVRRATVGALMQKNMMQRILELPAATALPASPGEAISRFRDEVEGVAISFLVFNNTIASAVFVSIAQVVMLHINTPIILGVFLPLALVVAAFNIASNRVGGYRKASRGGHRRRDRLPGRALWRRAGRAFPRDRS
jgi:ATP-binding cassette subfamily B protein